MQVSVVIVNYNVRPFLENALHSVKRALEGLESEIIVVDNASDDGSIEMVQQTFPDVTLIVNKTNVGFAAANNLALKETKGEFILLLNPDSILQEDTIRVMIDFLKSNPNVGLAGCKILNPDGTLQLPCRRSFPTPWVAFTKVIGLSALFPSTKLFGRYNLTYLNPDETYEVDAISGSFMFLRRKVYEQIGGFDEQFFMYGEDLDYCYRVQQSGWKVFYVHSTQVVHYKGESVKRSNIDEVKLFYQAMRLFVHKHLKSNKIMDLILSTGITLREWTAFLERSIRPLVAGILDFVLVSIIFFFAGFIRFGKPFGFPPEAYPIILTVPSIILTTVMFFLGGYTSRKYSISRSMYAVLLSFVIISALTFFFKQYGYSRLVVLIAGMISFIIIPGWRLLGMWLFRSPEFSGRKIFRSRTLIVGTNGSGQKLLSKLRTRVADGYEVVGFIDLNRRRIGEKIAGVEILGSIDNIGKVITEKKVSEVIFASDQLSYSTILSVINLCNNRSINFRLVPNSLEVIIGKSHIDQLDDIPLVDIEYNNTNYFLRRLTKRAFDIILSALLLITIYPRIYFKKNKGKPLSFLENRLLLLPKVFKGDMSLVGPPEYQKNLISEGKLSNHLFNKKFGLMGMIQLHEPNVLTPEEIEMYYLYYIKNQSLLLDFEIVLKSLLQLSKGRR